MKLAALALFSLALQDGATTRPDPPEDPLAALAPRSPIAGLVGFQSVSSVMRDDRPDTPHRLEAVYVFPGRARWWYSHAASQSKARDVVFQCGTEYFELEENRSQSKVLGDRRAKDERWRATCQGIELRRALFLWPDGFAWSGEGRERRADSDCGCSFVATLGDDGRPTALSVAREPSDESFRAITWREHLGRWWPSTMDLHHETGRIWREQVEYVGTQIYVLDLMFLPADRRPAPTTQPLMQQQLINGDIPSGHRLRVPVTAGASWVDVATLWDVTFQAHVSREAGAWKLEPVAWVELQNDGRPAALVVRFKKGSADPPPGLESVREQAALLVGLTGVGVDLGEAVRTLREAVPAGSRAGTAYARFPGNPSLAGPYQIYVALEAAQ